MQLERKDAFFKADGIRCYKIKWKNTSCTNAWGCAYTARRNDSLFIYGTEFVGGKATWWKSETLYTKALSEPKLCLPSLETVNGSPLLTG
jgi:hypothetical protein